MQNEWEIHISLIHLTFLKCTYMPFICANPWKTDPHLPAELDQSVEWWRDSEWCVRIKEPSKSIHKAISRDSGVGTKACHLKMLTPETRMEQSAPGSCSATLPLVWMNIPTFCLFPNELEGDSPLTGSQMMPEFKIRDMNTLAQKEHGVTAL